MHDVRFQATEDLLRTRIFEESLPVFIAFITVAILGWDVLSPGEDGNFNWAALK